MPKWLRGEKIPFRTKFFLNRSCSDMYIKAMPRNGHEPLFVSCQALYVRVVRQDGPQLSLIDLPGVTHNADQMQNIHEAGW